MESNIYPEIATIQIPVQVVRAGRISRSRRTSWALRPPRPIWPRASRAAADTCLPEHSHFIPMESPELTAKLIAKMLDPALIKKVSNECPSKNSWRT